ncbi:uncharacterized protein BX663DRAFT_519325 [Cokeromyces recurvatus]|uniref:uncharacterized protein n=1 Tax=Cokeromyces recurvatus TaxID=90255 RepID=UPI00221EB343|nr:uncharacterized protein BX663DRAFT_519325 [Cokeromyces recurvatus]KAI7900015.1 hypothetical protein BX663DRAFT_519325 [Cokeromyces recurvatus]
MVVVCILFILKLVDGSEPTTLEQIEEISATRVWLKVVEPTLNKLIEGERGIFTFHHTHLSRRFDHSIKKTIFLIIIVHVIP